MAAATSVFRSFSSTGSLVMLIQPSSSGSLRMATAFSALTRTGTTGSSVVGRVGVWNTGISGCTGSAAPAAGASGAAGGTVGFTTGAGAGDPAGAKKSSAAVSTASGTTGLTMARGGAFWSGSCPKVPPGPMMMGSMGSLPPSETEVSGPRSISNAARGWLEVTLTGSKAGAGRAGAGSGSTGAGGS